MAKKWELLYFNRVYIGVMEKNMETTIVYLGLYWGYIPGLRKYTDIW